jgi:hydrogenase maturation protease
MKDKISKTPGQAGIGGEDDCRTLVLGVGNVLRKDDGIGIAVIDRLRESGAPAGVRILDGGTAGIDLLPYLEGLDRLIIVDALFAEGKPGEVKVFSGDDLRDRDVFLSGHYGRLSDMLDMAAALWKRPETSVIGIVPLDCESYEMGLSPEVEDAIPRALDAILGMLT